MTANRCGELAPETSLSARQIGERRIVFTACHVIRPLLDVLRSRLAEPSVEGFALLWEQRDNKMAMGCLMTSDGLFAGAVKR